MSDVNKDLLAACEALLWNATLFNHPSDSVWIAVRDQAIQAIAAAKEQG